MKRIAGVDEAGRGPLAGPVVVAAVILDPSHPIAGLNDSKQLSEARRDALDIEIRARALAFCVIEVGTETIDRHNILQATLFGMRDALRGLAITPDEARVKELVTTHPHLANAWWDWGFGDWESPLGAAAHTGRRNASR